jgi:hypothetical protein
LTNVQYFVKPARGVRKGNDKADVSTRISSPGESSLENEIAHFASRESWLETRG